MTLDEGVASLIGRIYESADDDERWTRLLLDLRYTLSAGCLFETVSDLRRQDMLRITTIGEPRRISGEDEYRQGRYVDDPSFQWAALNPKARFCDTRTGVPPNPESAADFMRWVQEEYMGSTHWLVGYTDPEEDLTFGLSMHPGPHGEPISANQITLFKLFFNHMDRAIRLAARPPEFTSEDEALVILDRSGMIRGTSHAAAKILEERDGLRIRDQRLEATDPTSSMRLGTAIKSATEAMYEGGHGGAVAITRSPPRRALLLSVTPLINQSTPFGAWRSAALVRIVDPDLNPSEGAKHRWGELFAFTPTEARLAAILLSGDGNLHIGADSLRISYETARVHLRNVMQKTDTHTQGQLIRLLSKVG